MEIRQLQAFAVVAHTLNFSRAAEQLHLSQPALSKRIRALEEEIGQQLLLRTKRTVRITSAGTTLLGYADDILRRISLAADAVKRSAMGKIGKLAIGFCPGMEIRTLPRIVRAFRRRYPSVELRVHPLPSPEQVRAVREGRIDVGLVHLPVSCEGVGVQTLRPAAFILVSPKDHKLAHCSEAKLQALQGEPFILLSRHREPVYYDSVLSQARSAGVVLTVEAEATSFHDTLSLVASGLGLALLPAYVRELPWKGVAYCPIESPGPELESGIIFRQEPSGLTDKFLAVAKRA